MTSSLPHRGTQGEDPHTSTNSVSWPRCRTSYSARSAPHSSRPDHRSSRLVPIPSRSGQQPPVATGSSHTYTLDGLMEHNLGLIQLLLDLHDAIHLVRVLVGGDVGLERREGDGVT